MRRVPYRREPPPPPIRHATPTWQKQACTHTCHTTHDTHPLLHATWPIPKLSYLTCGQCVTPWCITTCRKSTGSVDRCDGPPVWSLLGQYPADKKSPKGKLRVLYEGFPMAMLTEQARRRDQLIKQWLCLALPCLALRCAALRACVRHTARGSERGCRTSGWGHRIYGHVRGQSSAHP